MSAARYVTTNGWNLKFSPIQHNLCLNPAEPCLTLDWAVAQSDAGDTIFIACGTYETAETVVLDKDLTISSQFAGDQCVNLKANSGRVLRGDQPRRCDALQPEGQRRGCWRWQGRGHPRRCRCGAHPQQCGRSGIAWLRRAAGSTRKAL